MSTWARALVDEQVQAHIEYATTRPWMSKPNPISLDIETVVAMLSDIDASQRQQVGWVDEFGNLFPMGAWKPSARTHEDGYKSAWQPVFA